MAMSQKREKKEKDTIDQLLDNIYFRGLTQSDALLAASFRQKFAFNEGNIFCEAM